MLLSVYEFTKKAVSSTISVFRFPLSRLFIHFSSFFRKMPVLARQVLRIGGKTARIDRIFTAFSRPLVASVKEPSAETKEKEKMPSSNSNLVMKYHKVLPEASTPTKGSARAAGYDLKSAENIVVPARGKALVDTGLKIEVPQGCYGRIAPRSGLAVKNFIDVGAGVVDEDYRGVIKVVLFNHSDAPFEVKKGDRIAQFICERIYYPELQEVKEVSETQRGEGGFGSTGTN